MVHVDFYEKPGCVGNAKQKQLLEAAGHVLRVHSILTESWTPERLRPFFGNRPVAEWFNPTAPAIAQNQIQPNQLDADEALALMVHHPILIRRPLMQVGDHYMAGFDIALVNEWLGLSPTSDLSQNVERCPRT